MVGEQHVATLIHEIGELKSAIGRFVRDADARSEDIIFDFAAITQWGYEIAERLGKLEDKDIPAPRSRFEAEDPAYLRALEDARTIHTDADRIDHDLSICLEAIASLTDPASLWGAIPHLEAELEALEQSLGRFASHLGSSATFPSD